MIDLCNEPGWAYDDLRALNSLVSFSRYDYARLLRQSGRISMEDLLKWLTSYRPTFRVVHGQVFLEELFSTQRYKELQAGGTSADVTQLFINLVNVSSIVGDSLEALTAETAKKVAAIWNIKLAEECPEVKERARVIYEKDDDQYFVTIDCVDPLPVLSNGALNNS